MLIIRLIGRDWLRPGITRMRLIMIQLTVSFCNGNDQIILMLITFTLIMIQSTVFIILSMMHHQRTILNDSDDKIDPNYDQYNNNWSNKYNSVLAVYKFCCNCFRANSNCKEQRNTDTTALISHWIKLPKNFCMFYMVAKKVNCSRNPFEKFQTRLN